MTTLSNLLAKVEGATEGSRELDCDITIALGLWTPPMNSERTKPDVWSRKGFNHYCPHEPVTTSVDAALGLIERVLPGRVIRLDIYATHTSVGLDMAWDGTDLPLGHDAEAPAPALALCLALLRALSSQQPAEVVRRPAGKESA